MVKHKENNRTFIHSIPSWITKNKSAVIFMNLLSWSISRVLSWTIIPLGDKLLCRSSNLPELWTGHPLSSYLVLLRVEFTFAARCYQRHGVLFLPHPFTLTVFTAVCSLLHWSSAHAARTLSGTLPFVARTFLSFTCPTRSCEHG